MNYLLGRYNAMLTTAMKQVYAFPASPYCEAGFDILNEKRHSRTPCGFFVSIAQPPVMTGCVEQPQGWPVLFPVCQLRTVRLPMFDIFVRRVFNLLQRKAIMNTLALTISEISIRQDGSGRYCLNDLHKAAGNDLKHQPSNFLRIDTTKGLIEELSSSDMRNITPVETIQGKGKQQGTFVVKELVYAYAMWISAKFHIAVIRAYDALMTKPQYGLKSLPEPPTITKAQQGELFTLVNNKAKSSGKPNAYFWSRYQNYFKLSSYKLTPADKFDEAMDYLRRLEGEDKDAFMMLTHQELSDIIRENMTAAKPKEGEVMPKQEANTFTVSFNEDSRLKNIMLKFDTTDTTYNRWFVTMSDGVIMVKPMPMDEMSLTFEQWIKYATQERGYIVLRKSDVIDKLTA